MNAETGDLLEQIGDLLELKGANAFKVRAYRNAARTIRGMGEDIETLHAEGKLTELAGVGKALSEKIGEFLETGSLKYLEDLENSIPGELLKMVNIPSLGPKKVMLIHKHLGIDTIEELGKAATGGKVEGLPGFGKVSQDNIIKGIKIYSQTGGRMLLGEALPRAELYLEYLKNRCKGIMERVSISGSLRRMCETIGDIDILAVPVYEKEGATESIMDEFVAYNEVKDVMVRGPTKVSVRLKDNVQVDLRVVARESWGAALQYFTGSKQHNIHARRVAISRGLKVNEYGVFDRDTGKSLAGRNEEEVYRTIGLTMPPPPCREDMGEVELALEGDDFRFVGLSDIKGDLHVHSRHSDGVMSFEEMVQEGLARGYSYMALTDHSPALAMIGGPDAQQLLENIETIHSLNSENKNFRLLAGCEVDILRDGTLDYPDHILEELDIVVASVHSVFSMERKEMTRRISDALSTSHVNILGHPTGRKLGRRAPYRVDMEKVMETALENSVAMELNSMPVRLDLSGIHVLMAREMGLKLAINTDAHKPHHLDVMRYGIGTARKGRATAKDVINTMELKELLRFLEK